MKILRLYYPEETVRLPREDAWAIDERRGIFAVADGVHLQEGIEYKGKYPRPSPAGKLAQEFCDNFLKFYRISGIKKAFARSNKSVFHLNKPRDKSKIISNAGAYYAATAAFGWIRNGVLEWGHICDSSVAVIDSRGKLLLWRTDHTHHNQFDLILGKYSPLDQSYMLRTVFRNALSPDGEKIGYGVITGELAAEKYAWFGKRKLRKKETVILATDGFESYLGSASFRRALITLDRGRIENTMRQLQQKHKNEFVSERTLIAVKI